MSSDHHLFVPVWHFVEFLSDVCMNLAQVIALGIMHVGVKQLVSELESITKKY